MNLEQFRASLSADDPPVVGIPLTALWYDGKGLWDIAHDVAQGDASTDGAWVHAYLHRKEGDLGNAAYWYRRAGKEPFAGDLSAEWAQLVTHFLGDPQGREAR